MRSLARCLASICPWIILTTLHHVGANTVVPNCSCGFYDASTDTLFTDSIIVYFNESTTLPVPEFVTEEYKHKYEKGWNSQYREGAAASNIHFSKPSANSNTSTGDSLELSVSPYQKDHLVVGSSIRTARRDIQYGSFTSSLRSPGQWAGNGGSALSMALQFNLTQLITINLQNTDWPSNASVSMLEGEEFPDLKYEVAYDAMINGTFGNGTISPWQDTEFRMDWTKKYVKFYIGGHLARTIRRKDDDELFSAPSPFYLRHWSNGDMYASQGPPNQTTTANVGWVRTFFNSSLMSENDHIDFVKRCDIADACLSSDTTLRGSSSYSNAALLEWKQKKKSKPSRRFSIWLAVACISMTTLLLLNPFWKRIREKTIGKKKTMSPHEPVAMEQAKSLSAIYDSRAPTVAGSANLTPINRTRAPSLSATTLNESKPSSRTATPYNRTRPSSVVSKNDTSVKQPPRSVYFEDGQIHFAPSKDYLIDLDEKNLGECILPKPSRLSDGPKKGDSVDEISPAISGRDDGNNDSRMVAEDATVHQNASPKDAPSTEGYRNFSKPNAPTNDADVTKVTPPSFQDRSSTTVALPPTALPQAKKRVDYLAGLVAVAALLVTAIHFSLTFIIGAINSGAYAEYNTITSILLNLVWIGPFLMTSTRFLVSSYLRTGNLLPIAEKTVGRTFRLMLPVAAIAMLEYFFINVGATKWLEYLPSVTWSTWPFVVGYNDFGHFVSEVLELAYLIPNAAPKITNNYCTGVLWTIPVQLQGSWLTLLAVIVIYEIKTPWKRFGFYAFCIVNHWYAVSWGMYFYFGILLTDLDITYNWRKYLHARPVMYYPLLTFFVLLAFASLGLDVLTQWTHVQYSAEEYGIHPEITTGLTVAQAGLLTSPQYYFPRINGISFAVGIQAAVELSPLIQKIFSFKALTWVFPHTFTIYLIHGFVFWSLGSWLCISFAARDMYHWLNIGLVALCCYTVMTLSLPLLTPVVETVGKTFTKDIWQSAREEPAPRQPTLYPFPSGFLSDRDVTPHEGKELKDAKIENMIDPEPCVDAEKK